MNFSTNGLIVPADYSQLQINQQNPLPAPGLLGLGWINFGGFTGTGNLVVVGTVTIAANTVGVYEGGAFLLPGVDGFVTFGEDSVNVSTASFTVVPEPSAALLLGVGIAGLAARRERFK